MNARSLTRKRVFTVITWWLHSSMWIMVAVKNVHIYIDTQFSQWLVSGKPGLPAYMYLHWLHLWIWSSCRSIQHIRICGYFDVLVEAPPWTSAMRSPRDCLCSWWTTGSDSFLQMRSSAFCGRICNNVLITAFYYIRSDGCNRKLSKRKKNGR